MKIDEAAINHNLEKALDNLSLADSVGDENNDWHKYNAGYIDGMIDLAKLLKEVLKA